LNVKWLNGPRATESATVDLGQRGETGQIGHQERDVDLPRGSHSPLDQRFPAAGRLREGMVSWDSRDASLMA
jgi:hypothetical protein